MRKKSLLVFSLTGAMVISTTAASAASVDMHRLMLQAPVASQVPATARLALADASTGQQSQQSAGNSKKKGAGTTTVVLLLLGVVGAVAALASSGGGSHPASP